MNATPHTCFRRSAAGSAAGARIGAFAPPQGRSRSTALAPSPSRSRSTALGLALGLALATSNLANAEPAVRTVLIESFGSVDCVDCADTRSAISALEVDLDVVAVEYHVEGPLAETGSIDRSGFYANPSLPTSVFDGRDVIAGGGDVSLAYRTLAETLAAGGSPLVIESSYNFNGDAAAGTLNVEIQVAPGEAIAVPAEFSVRAVLFENGVIECCGPGGGSSWRRVARRVLSDEPLEASVPGQVQFFRHVFCLDPSWDALRLGAIVFVQRDSDHRVLQAAAADDGGGLQPVPTTGIDESRVNLFQNIPNPTTGEARILFTLPRAQNTTVRVLDVRGALVRTLTDGPRPRGVHNVYWDGTDWRGRRAANGIYLYLLQTEDAVISKKLTLLR